LHLYLQHPRYYMRKKILFYCFNFLLVTNTIAQQSALPEIAVKNIGNKIIISWLNSYQKPIVTLNIQRSYDSLKNYKTIGEVLSPQSIENGFVDLNPPYNKMYYRVFVAFEGGEYVYSKITRPKKDALTAKDYYDTTATTSNINKEESPWIKIVPKAGTEILTEIKPKITYPSQTVYTLKDNNIVISLLNTATIKYSIKFFDEKESFLFEIKRVKEDIMIIEKVNFVRTGWYRFELYENGELIENNKFQITKALKGL
jgi:hypothetical protein